MVKRILLLLANPKGTPQLRLAEEVREIEEGLRRSKYRDNFILEQKWATRPRDIQRAILDINPQIIHFSGHGGGKEGLMFEDELGEIKLVDTEALVGLFKLFKDEIDCVILNGCYSEIQALIIAEYIDCVIGVREEIGNEAAIAFSVGFYDAIASGRTYEFAYESGCVAIQLSGVSEQLNPVLIKIQKNIEEKIVQLHEEFTKEDDHKLESTKESEKNQLDKCHLNLLTFCFESITVNEKKEIVNRDKNQAKFFTEKFAEDFNLDMVLIPSGKFIMGASEKKHYKENEYPCHEVKIKTFFLGKHQITQSQWRVIALLPEINYKLDPDPAHFKGDSRPIETVSWYEANEFCERLSRYTSHKYRLPSEAEWEYSCRAGTKNRFHCGETLTLELANYLDDQIHQTTTRGNYIGKTTSVMSFPPNAFGLYDMHGNTREWCSDHWHDNYQGAPIDERSWVFNGEKTFRILRGGSYMSRLEDCSSSSRHKDLMSSKNYLTSFRVACYR